LFCCPIGLSDHTLAEAVSIAGVSLGAKVVEKHFTLSRKIKTPDSSFSIEPEELKNLVRNIRIAKETLGRPYYGLAAQEKNNLIFRRSLFAVGNIQKGEVFNKGNIKSIRPGYGLPPKYLTCILGKKAKRNIKRGTPLNKKLY
ncbi:unnamed protein product, partial [marine sediment metagenome]